MAATPADEHRDHCRHDQRDLIGSARAGVAEQKSSESPTSRMRLATGMIASVNVSGWGWSGLFTRIAPWIYETTSIRLPILSPVHVARRQVPPPVEA